VVEQSVIAEQDKVRILSENTAQLLGLAS
jgi:hypothetical protein